MEEWQEEMLTYLYVSKNKDSATNSVNTSLKIQ